MTDVVLFGVAGGATYWVFNQYFSETTKKSLVLAVVVGGAVVAARRIRKRYLADGTLSFNTLPDRWLQSFNLLRAVLSKFVKVITVYCVALRCTR
jgi:hypothetical protein